MLFQILIIIDDFVSNPSFTHQSKLLHVLNARGRHNTISTLTATRKLKPIHPIVRVNATELYVYRLRNAKDLYTPIEEVSTVYDKRTLLALYDAATMEPLSFLYVELASNNKHNTFYKTFDHKLVITPEVED